jgi:hypothetical protein
VLPTLFERRLLALQPVETTEKIATWIAMPRLGLPIEVAARLRSIGTTLARSGTATPLLAAAHRSRNRSAQLRPVWPLLTISNSTF